MAASGVATADPARLAAIRPDLPIYLFSGTADPIAGGGALVELVGDRYREPACATSRSRCTRTPATRSSTRPIVTR